jgi:hypothetical protein
MVMVSSESTQEQVQPWDMVRDSSFEIGFTLPTEETIIMAAIIKSAANADNSEAILFLLNMITLNPSSSKKYKNYKLSIAKSTGLNNIK